MLNVGSTIQFLLWFVHFEHLPLMVSADPAIELPLVVSAGPAILLPLVVSAGPNIQLPLVVSAEPIQNVQTAGCGAESVGQCSR